MENQNNQLQVLTKIYEGQEVAFRETNGQSEVQIDAVAKFCGWTKTANSGNEVIRWSRVNEYLTELGVTTCGHGDFIPEYIMYALIGKAKNKRATDFMLWVGKVLVDIRQNGAYVSKDITKEQEEKLDKYSTTRKIKNTFNICPLEDIEQEFKECMSYHRNKDGKEKNIIQKNIINALEERKQNLISANKGTFALVIADSINSIKKKQLETNNKSRGQIISYKTKEIKKLKEQLNYYEPEDYEWITLNVHPYSHNYMIKATKDWNTGEPRISKSEGYYNWQKKFPYDELPSYEELGIDFNKRVCVWFRFVAKSTFDSTNCHKTVIDTICNFYGVDDNKVELMECKKINDCNSFDEGKVQVAFRNQ